MTIKFSIILVTIILTAPNIHSQATGISNPETTPALTCRGIHTNLRVAYSGIPEKYFHFIDARDLDGKTFENGTVKTLPNVCQSIPGRVTYSVILSMPKSSSGTDTVYYQTSYPKRDFTVYENNKIELTINSAYPIPITLDGIAQGPDVSVFELDPGQHTFSVPESIQLKADSRLKFESWSDGSTAPNRTEYLTGNATFTAIYVTQYSLTLLSPEVNVTGAGWYDAGTPATFSALSSAPMRGILGFLGARWLFQGWYEGGDTLVTSSNQGSVAMTKSRWYRALWAADYTVTVMVLGIAIPVAFAGIYLYRRRTSDN